MAIRERQYSLKRLFLAVSTSAAIVTIFCTRHLTLRMAFSLAGWFGLVWLAAWLWFVGSYRKPIADEIGYRLLAVLMGILAGFTFLPICLMQR
jgi:hypothetical protein